MKKLYTPFILILLFTFSAFAQNSDWKTKEDYLRDTAQVAKTIVWLEENPFPDSQRDRQEKAQYAFKWLEGAPYSVTVDGIFIQDIMQDNSFA
ncbi:hypothetical protein [Pontibacter sp. SGAir0037]|uniref:hypothetical protein n=1 Tax=Pontibacter sp. SGAir0037 TaxID=2571030 RepID=UPI0010CD6432|nr:hypothetical protein [Pontibacter sp. SGAir0037]QCR24246.1 hypothetical protein C1N53_19050 [Pontibacter sp. SGAir0037]